MKPGNHSVYLHGKGANSCRMIVLADKRGRQLYAYKTSLSEEVFCFFTTGHYGLTTGG